MDCVFFYFIGNSYEVKTLREDAHDAQAESVASRLRVSARVRFANPLFGFTTEKGRFATKLFSMKFMVPK